MRERVGHGYLKTRRLAPDTTLPSRSLPVWWGHAAVLPLVALLSVLPLIWFGRNWRVSADGSLYLLEARHLLSGSGYTAFGGVPQTVRGPVFPAILSLLILVFGRDLDALAWAVRLLVLVNPVLLYLLVRRLAGTSAGLLAAALMSVFGYSAALSDAFNIDAVSLIFFLLALLALFAAVDSGGLWLAALSGLLIGVSILTKETLFTALPVGVFAALWAGWSARGVPWHYGGVLVVCLPWWAWVWYWEREVYLVGRLPSGLIAPALVVALVLLGLGIAAWRRRVLHRLVEGERRRRVAAWPLVILWSVALTVLLQSTIGGRIFRDTALREYVQGQVLRDTSLWPLLPVAGAYLLWRTLRGHRLWGMYLAVLVMLIPVALLVLAQRYATRQWMVPQTLLYGALAALTVESVRLALTTLLDRRSTAETSPVTDVEGVGAARVTAVALSILLVGSLSVAAVSRVNALWTQQERIAERDPNNQVNSAVLAMRSWMTENVPRGSGVLATWLYSSQLAFADERDLNWAFVRRDCLTRGDDLERALCARSATEQRAWPPPSGTFWVSIGDNCDASSLSLDGVLAQMDQARAEYFLVTREPGYQTTLAWVGPLVQSGAFEIVHSTYLRRGPTVRQARGLVLLHQTGEPGTVGRVIMDGPSATNLITCERAQHGDDYAEAIRSTFPRGISVLPGTPGVEVVRREIQGIYTR